MNKRDLKFLRRINKIINKWNRKIKSKDRFTNELKERIRKEIYPIYVQWYFAKLGLYKLYEPMVGWDDKYNKIYYYRHNVNFPIEK